MTTALDVFAKRRQRGAALLDELADAASLVEAEHAETQLRSVAERSRAGRFVVLLLGGFSSGKSTLLNALLGRPSLPVKVNPCTAILTEVVYGETPSVTVRYRDDTERTMDVDAFLEEFQLRTSSEEEAGAEAKDRFGDVDRAILAYPLPLLENGVVLLDTPGLDDDEVRTARTLSSLPDADAVIVVLNATRFLTDLEVRTLQRQLAPLGLTNLFFPVTMVDLLDALADDPEKALADIEAQGREVLGRFCSVDGEDRFDERFFPVNPRGALQARWDRSADAPRDPVDTEQLTASGVPLFEDSLEHFLIRERGRVQLRHLEVTAKRIRADLDRQSQLDRATSSASVEELKERQESLEPRFTELSAIAGRVGRTADHFIARQQQLIYQDLRDFLIRTEEDLPDAVAGFELGGLASLDLLTARGRAKVEAALRKELEAWLDERVTTWQSSLRPRIESALLDLKKEIAGDATDFDQLSQTIVTDFAGGAFDLEVSSAGASDVEPGERWFSVALGAVLLSPGTMAAGWTEGYEGALKGAASRLGVRIALLTLGALLGPVGWLGIVLYIVSDAVLLVLTGGGQLQRLRSQVADNLQGKLVAQADQAKDDIFARVQEGFQPLRDALVGAATDEAEELRQALDHTIAAREAAAASAKKRAEQWDTVLTTFDEALTELATLSDVDELAS